MSDTNVFFSAVQSALDAHIERMVEGRVVALAQRIIALEERLAALENNPAQGVDTTLEARVKALEAAPNAISAAAFVTYLDQQEWFWEKVRGVADAAAEQVMEDHTGSYDHDDYDRMYNEWGSEDVSDFVKEGDLDDLIEEKAKEVLNNASFSISI